jgi:hypothetical protein
MLLLLLLVFNSASGASCAGARAAARARVAATVGSASRSAGQAASAERAVLAAVSWAGTKAVRSAGGELAARHRFGFVVGVHFSGTSILHYALGRHPDVSIMRVSPQRMDEGQYFQDVMPRGASARAACEPALGTHTGNAAKELGEESVQEARSRSFWQRRLAQSPTRTALPQAAGAAVGGWPLLCAQSCAPASVARATAAH